MLYSGILCRHTERIESHWMEDIIPCHRPVARHDIANRIVPYMTHMKIAGRIWEHLQRIVLLLIGIHLRLVDVVFLPFLLPFLLDFLRNVFSHER